MDAMSITVAINSILAGVKTATDIAKCLMDADSSVKRAELKAKLAAMMEALAEARRQMADIRQAVTEKDEVIAKLQQALELKGKLVPKDSVYWLPDEKGNLTDGPFCPRCWQADHVARTLVPGEREPEVKCPACKSSFPLPPVYGYLRPDVIEARRQIERENEQAKNDYERQIRSIYG